MSQLDEMLGRLKPAPPVRCSHTQRALGYADEGVNHDQRSVGCLRHPKVGLGRRRRDEDEGPGASLDTLTNPTRG